MKLPPGHRGIEGENDEGLSRIVVIRHDSDGLLVDINIVPNGDGLLMLNERLRRHDRVVARYPIGMRRRQRDGHGGRVRIVTGVVVIIGVWIGMGGGAPSWVVHVATAAAGVAHPCNSESQRAESELEETRLISRVCVLFVVVPVLVPILIFHFNSRYL